MATRLHKTDFRRLSPEELGYWQSIPTGIISDGMDKAGTLDAAIRPVTEACRFVGQALTVRVMSAGNVPVVQAIQYTQAGDVIMIDATGHTNNAVSGGFTGGLFLVKGAVALVADGSLRDVAEIREQNMPSFARGLTPAGPHKDDAGDINSVISCGGVTVHPGDVIIGDDDGVVVVPIARLEELKVHIDAVNAKEAQWADELANGRAFHEILGLPSVEEV